MKHGKHIQVSESFLLCALLTMTGGFLDVYTYITRGHVFANAQTGNSVATTMCTGNLRSATEQIFHYVRTRDPDTKKTILSYYEIVVFFALGAKKTTIS